MQGVYKAPLNNLEYVHQDTKYAPAYIYSHMCSPVLSAPDTLLRKISFPGTYYVAIKCRWLPFRGKVVLNFDVLCYSFRLVLQYKALILGRGGSLIDSWPFVQSVQKVVGSNPALVDT